MSTCAYYCMEAFRKGIKNEEMVCITCKDCGTPVYEGPLGNEEDMKRDGLLTCEACSAVNSLVI